LALLLDSPTALLLQNHPAPVAVKLSLPYCSLLSTTLRHFFPLCAPIVDGFENMSRRIVCKTKNTCGISGREKVPLWHSPVTPQLVASMRATSHTASLKVATNPEIVL
jgi:hypothetical protein